MKKYLNKTVAALAAVAAVAFALTLAFDTQNTAKATGLGGTPVTIYSTAYQSTGGATNTTTGYTNSGTYAAVQGTLLTFDVKYGGNNTNNLTLAIYPAFDSGSHATAVATRIALPNTVATYTEAVTNVSNWGAPYVFVVFETPTGNVETHTNVVVRLDSSIP